MKLKFPLRGRSFLPCLLVLCLHFSVIHVQEPTLVSNDIQTSTNRQSPILDIQTLASMTFRADHSKVSLSAVFTFKMERSI